MTAMSNDQFASEVLRIARTEEPFRPVADYDPDGDCIEFLFKPDPFYAERIDDLVTVYYSQDSGEVIGSLIKGVKHLCRRKPGLRILVDDGRVKLEHLFIAYLADQKEFDPDDVDHITYRKTYRTLIDAAEKSDLDANVGAC